MKNSRWYLLESQIALIFSLLFSFDWAKAIAITFSILCIVFAIGEKVEEMKKS